MSIKDDVSYIKNELSNEEKFLENFVKTERFFKKYKRVILVVVTLVVVGLIAYFTKKSIDESNLYSANIELNKFLDDSNKEALANLKDRNKTLYEIALYLEAKKNLKSEDISLPYLKELLDFQVATTNSNLEKLDELIKNGDFLLKDYAIFNKAFILVNNKQYQEAKVLLEQISQDSKAFELANLLKHYLVTK